MMAGREGGALYTTLHSARLQPSLKLGTQAPAQTF